MIPVVKMELYIGSVNRYRVLEKRAIETKGEYDLCCKTVLCIGIVNRYRVLEKRAIKQ